MLRNLGYEHEASVVEDSVRHVLIHTDCRTKDLGGKATTTEFTQEVIRQVKERI